LVSLYEQIKINAILFLINDVLAVLTHLPAPDYTKRKADFCDFSGTATPLGGGMYEEKG